MLTLCIFSPREIESLIKSCLCLQSQVASLSFNRPTRLLTNMLVDDRLSPLEQLTLNMTARLVMPDRNGVLQAYPIWKAEKVKASIMKRARLASNDSDTQFGSHGVRQQYARVT